jgi:S-adenosylmethionine synthetase
MNLTNKSKNKKMPILQVDTKTQKTSYYKRKKKNIVRVTNEEGENKPSQ